MAGRASESSVTPLNSRLAPTKVLWGFLSPVCVADVCCSGRDSHEFRRLRSSYSRRRQLVGILQQRLSGPRNGNGATAKLGWALARIVAIVESL